MITDTKNSFFDKIKVGCGKCHEIFEDKQVGVVDFDSDNHLLESLRDLSIFSKKCKKCGNIAVIPIMFAFISFEKKLLWFVYDEQFGQKVLLVEKQLRAYLKEYLAQNAQIDSKEIADLELSYVPLPSFLKLVGSPLVEGDGIGRIHFSPFPKFSVAGIKPPKGIKSVNDCYIAMGEGNHPEYFDVLWKLTENNIRLGFNSSNVIIDIEPEENQQPSGTYGFAEIMIYVGSSVVLPIILGVVSSLISNTVLQKQKAKRELAEKIKQAKARKNPRIRIIEEYYNSILAAQDNPMEPSDEAKLIFRVSDSNEDIVIAGSLHSIAKQMLQIRKESLLGLKLVGDCHVALFRGEVYIDGTLKKDECDELTKLSDRYLKIFSKDTRVRYFEGKRKTENFHNSIHVAKQASALIKEEKYEEAILLLSKLPINEDTSIDALYNLALCLKELGDEDQAINIFEEILARSINLPPIGMAESTLPGAWSQVFK